MLESLVQENVRIPRWLISPDPNSGFWSGRQDSNLRHLAPKDAREHFYNLMRSVWWFLFQKIDLSGTFCPTDSDGFISKYGQVCGHNPAIPERHKPFGDRFLSLKCVDCSAGDQGSQGFPDVRNWDAENKEVDRSLEGYEKWSVDF